MDLENAATYRAATLYRWRPRENGDTLIFVPPEEHAEHAQVTNNHLEIYQVGDRWLWRITGQYSEVSARGEEDSLANARQAASKAVGKTPAEIDWKRIDL